MKYELNQERILQIAQPMSELQGVVNYLAFAGHSHLSSSVTDYQLRFQAYCDTIPESYAVLEVTKKYMSSNWERYINRGTLEDGTHYYCIHYTFNIND